MGSFLSSFSGANPADDLELQSLSRRSTHAGNRRSGRSHPLSHNGHSTSDLLTPSFRRRSRTNTNTPTHIQAVESPTDTSHSVEPATESNTSAGFSMMHRPFNLKLDELTAFNIEYRDRTIAQLRRDLRERNNQLSDAQKEIKTLKRLQRSAGKVLKLI